MQYNGLIFKNRKFDFEKLQSFGFKLSGKEYIYKTNIIDDSFNLTLKIDSNENIDIKLVELDTSEEYNVVFVKSAEGEFVGRVKEELENFLTKIKEECTFFTVFQSEYANLVIEYIKEKYGDEAEFLWEKFPDNCIFRRNDKKGKWYAVILTVKKNKIGLEGDDTTEVINLKTKPETIVKLVDNKKYFPAYHMNKKHWFTICLDGSVSLNNIKNKIDESYNII